MILTSSVTLDPYEVDLYVMSTETKEEDKKANKNFRKESKKIGIDVFGPNDDGRDYISAFASGTKKKRTTACIYIRKKTIDESSLDHELIHCYNFINEIHGVSTESGHDESTAYFFESMKKNVLKLLKKFNIKVIQYKL